MSTKTVILLSLALVLGLVVTASSLTPHKEYATMEIKDCNACHLSSNVTFNHGSMWLREHRLYSEKHPNNCEECHQQSFCYDCHWGGGIDQDLHASNSGPDYMPRSHRTNFREIHPIKAQEDPRSCYRCHDAQKFCQDCHSRFPRNELAPVSHRAQFRSINLRSVGPNHAFFNPAQCPTCHPGGALPSHQWSSGHAREARRNLSACQTCHPEGDVCMTCHSAANGLRISPHPRNWGSLKNRFGRVSDNKTCRRCHITLP